MKVTVRQLVDKYSWEEIEPVIFSLYPTQRRPIIEYKEAYQKFSIITPTETEMRIFIEKKYATTGETWYDFFGKDGTLVKDSFSIKKEAVDENLKAIGENEQCYAISYQAWAEIAGM